MLFSTPINDSSPVPGLIKKFSFWTMHASLLVLILLLSLGSSTLRAQSNNTSGTTCPQDITGNSEPGKCGAIVHFGNTTTSDPNNSVLYSKPSGSLFPIGTTTVVAKQLDENGVTVSSCSFNITVRDAEAPLITDCPQDVNVVAAEKKCGATIIYSTPNIAQSCINRFITFSYTGSAQEFTVPPGVTSLKVDVRGAGGGFSSSNGYAYGNAGLGGRVEATIAVTPGQKLAVRVGGTGGSGTGQIAGTGGFNGGGEGSAYIDPSDPKNNNYAGGGGGGASDLRPLGASLSDRIIVAGGGGASGYYGNGGHGGGLTGGEGLSAGTNATGGSQTTGGKGGIYSDMYFGSDGGFGVGGMGADGTQGGGGGAGWYGGGGGAFGDGGGGSNFTAPEITNIKHTQGYQDGPGSITIHWVQPATIVQTEGLPSGSLFPVGTTVNTFTATDAAGNIARCSFTVTVSDNQKPALDVPGSQELSHKSDKYFIPAAVASDNCGIATVSYTVSGATTRGGEGADASGAFNPGSSVITWTAKDINGNIETATTAVNVNPAASLDLVIADVYSVSPGGKPNTLYNGYGPATLLLKVSTTGTGPFSYKWTKNDNDAAVSEEQAVRVASAGEYMVTVTDANGNYGVAKKTIQNVDVRCGNKNQQVSVCKGGEKVQSLCADANGVAGHLERGGVLGECSTTFAGGRVAVEQKPQVLVEVSDRLKVYPNPTTGVFFIQLNNFLAPTAQILLLSANGKTIEQKSVALTGGKTTVSFNIKNATPGVYFIKVISDDGTQTARVVMKP